MTLALGRELVGVGSAPDNDVVVAAPGVAPHHARVVRQGGQLFFVDLGAAPSTANGVPVAPQQAEHGQVEHGQVVAVVGVLVNAVRQRELADLDDRRGELVQLVGVGPQFGGPAADRL